METLYEYCAFIAQDGENAPTVLNTLVNTLGETPTFTRDVVGRYGVVLNNINTQKCICFIFPNTGSNYPYVAMYISDETTFNIISSYFDTGEFIPSDSIITNNFIYIRYFPDGELPPE